MRDLFDIVSTIAFKKALLSIYQTDYSVNLSLHRMKEAMFTVLRV
jgi:hypothetical protein